MRRITKKSIAVVTGFAVVLAGAGVAYAYWTAGGSGTGTAATGTSVALTAVQTSTVSAMGPGVAAQSLNGNFNNTNAGPVYVQSVTASISDVTAGGVSIGAACDADDYTLTGAAMTVAAEVPAGSAQGSWTGATIEFNNKAAVNQDACKNAVVRLAYAIA